MLTVFDIFFTFCIQTVILKPKWSYSFTNMPMPQQSILQSKICFGFCALKQTEINNDDIKNIKIFIFLKIYLKILF